MEVLVMIPVALVAIALLALVIGWVTSRVSGRETGPEEADAPGDVSSGPQGATHPDEYGGRVGDPQREPVDPHPTDGDRPAEPGAEPEQPRPSRSMQEDGPGRSDPSTSTHPTDTAHEEPGADGPPGAGRPR
ncbi:hypothetical protein ER308_01600 [Egibacter rhizosphaerae]|uniref:Uncharacterized protein n=1 Tax=Egibacter rhizosphaerae TaxID=1670831 RepID=A0A411YAY1_9ACTN|nr:hypothetical protein [Egibacter rhizosphaerae]QBI18393.1 hypothetical protein ER308_01600 [Egibacter rhizosphaerae]